MAAEIILERLAYGHPIEELLDDYPFLTQADIYAALEYALALVQAEAHPEERGRQSELLRWFSSTANVC